MCDLIFLGHSTPAQDAALLRELDRALAALDAANNEAGNGQTESVRDRGADAANVKPSICVRSVSGITPKVMPAVLHPDTGGLHE